MGEELKGVSVSRAQIMREPSSMFQQGFEFFVRRAGNNKDGAWVALTAAVDEANRSRSLQGIESKIPELLKAEFDLACLTAGESSPEELRLLRIAQDNNPEGRRAAREWFAKMGAYYSQGASRAGIEGKEAHSRVFACKLAGEVLAEERGG